MLIELGTDLGDNEASRGALDEPYPQVSEEKARSACLYRGPTKAAEEAVAKGGLGVRLLKLSGMIPLEGGLVLVANGQTVGAVGVSGAQSDQDGQIAKAGADALK